MEDRGDFWVPKRRRAPQPKKPALKTEDDDLEAHLTASKLQQAIRQSQNSEELIDSLETPRANKTRYPPSTHHDPHLEPSKELLHTTLYGNRPKWSPVVDKSTGEIDTRALSRYDDSVKHPRKPPSNNTNNNARSSKEQTTRKSSPKLDHDAQVPRDHCPQPQVPNSTTPLG